MHASSLVVSAVALLCSLGVDAKAIKLEARAPTTPVVDLGYSVYQGSYDNATNINVFKGIRYAAPPLGNLRWAAPQLPAENRTSTILATSDPPSCPQTGASNQTPAAYGFTSAHGNEDCLFLNVYAPANATNLPVFFWIHGGGYGLFSAAGLDATPFIHDNGNNFIAVVIQYRLGAFGFLASEDIKEGGTLNAGLLDMNFALQWVQNNIKAFGGDASRVTIAGESAGAAATLYQAMSYGGKQNRTLFNNIISASPWIPNQYNYNDPAPTQHYQDFAKAAGCPTNVSDTLACLRATNSTVLQDASARVSEAGPFGTFAFLPVTDGIFITERPTQALFSKHLKGQRILSGNNANEGVPLSPPTAVTLQDFRDYIDLTYPSFSASDKAALEGQYSYVGDDQPTDPSSLRFETSGTGYPTAVNQSGFATGQTQRLFDVFAESTFDCPSYWLASAFPTAWKYQYSVSPAYHGADLQALWSASTVQPGIAFKYSFHKIWGNFIVYNTPVITISDATGGASNATVPVAYGGVVNWPQWNDGKKNLLSLNTTGGIPVFLNVTENLQYYIYEEPGIVNSFKLGDGQTWEGGRGTRCEWWSTVADKVPY